MLRLRLQIQRNELPTVNTLWPIKPTQSKHTIVQLLEQVNLIFPLESSTWGLEHYQVSIGDYECLHYYEVGAVFKDEDEVVIRPLQYAEVRARTLLGRDQIAPDGRHLYDGVPWGKPLLRAAMRPVVRIPPRKRLRTEEFLDAEEVEGGEVVKAIMGRDDFRWDDQARLEQGLELEAEDEEDEEDEEDFIPVEEDSVESDSDEVSSAVSSSVESTDPSSDSESEESEDPSSDDSDDESEQSFAGFLPDDLEPPSIEVAPSFPKKDEVTLEKRAVGIPFQGTDRTHTRNARRRHQRMLQHLVASERLPKNSTLQDLFSFLASGEDVPGVTHDARVALRKTKQAATSGEKYAMVEKVVKQTGSNELSESQQSLSQAQELEVRRKGLLDAIASGGVDITDNDFKGYSNKRKASEALEDDDDEDPPDEISAKPSTGSIVDDGSAEDTDLSTRQRITRTTEGAPARMIFAAFGVGVPKTDEDRERVKKKLAVRPGRETLNFVPRTIQKIVSNAEPVIPELPDKELPYKKNKDDEGWRNSIDLSAVECVGRPLKNIAPPFPFRQHWHNKKKSRNQQAYMEQKQWQNQSDDQWFYHTETYDKYNTDGDGDALDYDDVQADNEDDYRDDTFLEDTYDAGAPHDPASQQLLNETESAQAHDDFPILPEDLSALTPLIEDGAQTGDFIVFDELTCSAATNWQPKTLTLTARLESKSEDGWELQLAKRDMASKTYDDQGNRVYAKFEMGGLSDDEDEEDDRVRNVQWSELGAPRLLLRPSSV